MESRRKLKRFYEDVGRRETIQDTYESPLPSKRYFYQDRFRTVLKALGNPSGEVVADVGCGLGIYTAKLAEMKAKLIIALDISLPFLESARKLLLSRGLGSRVEFVLADAERLPFRSEAFDKVLCTEVLEHLVDPWKALKEIARVCVEGGILVATVPSAYSYAEAERNKRLKRLNRLREHLHKFTLGSFKRFLEASGFKVLRVEGCFFYFPGFSTIFNRVPSLLPLLKPLKIMGETPGLKQLGWCLVFKAVKLR